MLSPIEQWKSTILKSYQNKHNPSDTEVEHILDYISKHPSLKIHSRVSYLSLKKKAADWTVRLNKRNENLKHSGSVESIISFPEGFSFVRLLDQTAKNWEGKHMGHCVASYSDHDGIYSLRDKDNIPHCTIEASSYSIRQIKGQTNGLVKVEYVDLVMQGLTTLGRNLDTNDLGKIGYYHLTDKLCLLLEEFFVGVKKIEIDNKKYIYIHNQLTLAKPLSAYSLELKNFLLTFFNCFEAFKQLLILVKELPNQVSIFKDIFHEVCCRGNLDYLKAMVEVVPHVDKLFLYNFKAMEKALEIKNEKFIEYVMETLSQYRQELITKNPYADYCASVDLVQALHTAIRQDNIFSIKLFLRNGAKIKPDWIEELFCLGIEKKESFLIETGKAHLAAFGPQRLISILIKAWESENLELLHELIASCQDKQRSLKHFYNRAAQRQDCKLIDWLLLNYPSVDYLSLALVNSGFHTRSIKFLEFLENRGADILYHEGSFFKKLILDTGMNLPAAYVIKRGFWSELKAGLEEKHGSSVARWMSDLKSEPLPQEIKDEVLLGLCELDFTSSIGELIGWGANPHSNDNAAWRACCVNKNVRALTYLRAMTQDESFKKMKNKDLAAFLGVTYPDNKNEKK